MDSFIDSEITVDDKLHQIGHGLNSLSTVVLHAMFALYRPTRRVVSVQILHQKVPAVGDVLLCNASIKRVL